MEPISAFASVVTIVGLLRPTARFVKSLKGITSDEGLVAMEVGRMATRIETSATSIDVSLQALKGHSSTLAQMQETSSNILQYIIDNNLMDMIISGTENVSKQMIDMTRDLKDLRERPRIIKMIKWFLRDKLEVESLFPEMQLVAACLSLVCPIIQLEIDNYILKKSSGEVAQCLKHEIIMQEQQLSMNGESDFEAEFLTGAKPLLRLARSVRHTGTAPLPRRASTRRRASASEETSSHTTDEPPVVSDDDGNFEVPQRTSRNAPQRSTVDRSSSPTLSSRTPPRSASLKSSTSHKVSLPREVPPEAPSKVFSPTSAVLVDVGAFEVGRITSRRSSRPSAIDKSSASPPSSPKPRRASRSSSRRLTIERSSTPTESTATPRRSTGLGSPSSHRLSLSREVPPEALRYSSSSAESSRPPSSIPSPPVQIPETPPTPRSPNIAEMPKPLTLRNSTPVSALGESTQAVQGFIITPADNEEPIPLNAAKVDPQAAFNYISVTTAKKFGLDRYMKDLEPGDYTRIHDDGEETDGRVIGKVLGVGWRKKKRSKGIELDLMVKDCYHGGTGEYLIFGASFADALENGRDKD
ncbi:hypothetical protein FBEOM_3583 [Fusarium beomiforme]|uniref:Uncharacterized protein n=1 Tax=Fusarium beomiforme TaxID=44412 RepID=A0A9P5APS0_9HYPO|nr:hypothetical protein FBEOM_3583 [Fusarium beomiforme]